MDTINFNQNALAALIERQKVEAQTREQTAGPVLAMRWSAAQTCDALYWTAVRTGVEQGARAIDQPIEIPNDLTCLMNFGSSPTLLKAFLLQSQNQTPQAGAAPDRQTQAYSMRCLGFMEMHYSEMHSSTGCYNFEPWVQEMYRDCLNVDYRERLLNRLALLQEDLRTVPARLHSLGIPVNMVNQIMHALKRFQSIEHDSHNRERNKTSIIKARTFVSVQSQIDEVMRKAESFIAIDSFDNDGSPLQRLFDYWKEGTFECLEVRNTIKGLSTTSQKEGRLAMYQLLEAVQETACRCAEDNNAPACSLLLPEEVASLCPRQVIEDELEALQMHDILGALDTANDRLETRRFGPLCALLVPGSGNVRYSTEIRKFQQQRLDVERDKKNKQKKQGFDLSRRTTYPLNYIVVPGQTPAPEALDRLADAFLEYKSIACPPAYQNFVGDMRKSFADLLSTKTADDVKNPMRKQIARYLAGFVRWAKYGRLNDLPRMEEFVNYARSRLRRPALLIPPRYRCIMDDFAEASEKRRDILYQQHMGDRYTCDRIQLSLAILKGDAPLAAKTSNLLPGTLQENRYLERALSEMETNPPHMQRPAIESFKRFVFSDSELKRIYLTAEAQFSGEVDMIRTKALAKLGRELAYEEAAASIGKRQQQKLASRRQLANARLDQDLLGLLYSVEKNYTAAVQELEQYLARLEAQRERRVGHQPRYDGSSLKELGERASRGSRTTGGSPKTETRVVGLESADEPLCEDDFVYYNLGALHMRLGDYRKASDYFSRFCLWAAQQNWHLFGIFARELNEEIKEKLSGE